MSIKVTPHSAFVGSTAYKTAGARGASDTPAPVLGAQIADGYAVAISAVGATATVAYFARIYAVANCSMRIGKPADPAAAFATAEYLPAGTITTRLVQVGERISVGPAS